MLDVIPAPMITAAVSAGMGAYIKLKAQSIEAERERTSRLISVLSKKDSSADKAEKRGDSWSRRFIVSVVITVAFLGLLVVAFSDINVSYLYETPVKEWLGGLITTGGKIKTITAPGFVLPPYVEHGVLAIIFFHFGAGAAKTK